MMRDESNWTCGECAHFTRPKRSLLFDGALQCDTCPHACHKTDNGSYTVSFMAACRYFTPKIETELVLF